MSEVLAYATADWHVPETKGGGAWKSLSGIGGDVLFALEQTVALCVKDRADLWAAGDIVDGPDVEPDALADLYAVLRPLTYTDLRIYYVLGNHDAGRDWLAALGPTAVNVSGRAVQTPKGYTITGSSFVEKELFRQTAGSCAKTDVGLYHQTWQEWTNGGGRSTLADIPNHTLAVCGDVHVRGIATPPKGPVTALSPGPMAPQSVAEFAEAKVFAVGKDLFPTEVSIRGRQYRAYEVSDGKAADAVIADLTAMTVDESLPQALRTPMVSVCVRTPIDGFEAAVTKMAASRGVIVRVYAPAPTRVEKPEPASQPKLTGLTSVIINWDADPAAKQLAAAAVARGVKPQDVLLAHKDNYERAKKHAPAENRTT